jgi:glycosyltransferase involved in cell wall biosynthesis
MNPKVIVLVSFSDELGGAQIRYINLFKEIYKRAKDYSLIINRSLYNLAIEGKLLDYNQEDVIILEIEKSSIKNSAKKLPEAGNFGLQKPTKFKTIKFLGNTLLEFKQLVSFSYKLHCLLKPHKPKYVYAVWLGGMIAWPLKYIYRFKFVYSFMDSGYSSIYRGIKHLLKNERFALMNADVIDFLSDDLLRGVDKRVNLHKKTIKAVSVCSFKNYNNLYPEEVKLNNVVFASRMTPIKNPMLFMESILLFNQQYGNWKDIKFQFLGNGELISQMENFKTNHALSNVELLGYVNNPVEYLKKSKVFMSVQQSNNYPSQSLLEAMACENAIIASDVGETRKLVSETEGILVKLDAREISKAMIFLFDNEAQREGFAKSGREKVLKEHNVERYLEYFYSLENL